MTTDPDNLSDRSTFEEGERPEKADRVGIQYTEGGKHPSRREEMPGSPKDILERVEEAKGEGQ